MKYKKVLITQSNYIPWKGYFDAMHLVDEVILYDDMQYTRRDWRNRNRIKTNSGLMWLSIPVEVKGKYLQSIKDTMSVDSKWTAKHWKSIEINYSKAPYFKDYKSIIESLYLDCSEISLSLINYHFIKAINEILGISTKIRFSSDFELVEGKTSRLADLCEQLNATDYYTGPSASNYIDESIFTEKNINVHYLDFSNYPEYNQLYAPFEHGVTILDLIFNTGKDANKFLKYF